MSLSKYKLKPEETYFMDDLIRNVEGAKKLNIHAHHFLGFEKDYENIMREIKAL